MMTTVTRENLMRYYRTGANLTQAEFAAAMGMPFRSYQDIETGKSPVRPIHVAAARWALVELASRSDLKSGYLPLEIAQVVKEAAK